MNFFIIRYYIITAIFHYVLADDKFNISAYLEFLHSFGERNSGMKPKSFKIAKENWDLMKNHSIADAPKKEYIFYSETAENCPKPVDGVLVWEPPKNEVYGESCKAKLNSTVTRNILLSAMRPPVEGYPLIRGFFHVTLNVTTYLTRDRHDAIFETQLQKLAKSNLLEHAQLVLRLGLLDVNRNHTLTNCVKEFLKARIKLIAKWAEIEFIDASLYECNTIDSLQQWCDSHKSAFVFYLHNKGFSHIGQGPVSLFAKHWQEYMMFFLFQRWWLCANSLTHGSATCGVRKVERHLRHEIFPTHYSGNFWWSRCDHVVRIQNPCPFGRLLRHAAEFWLISDSSLLNDEKSAVELWHGEPSVEKAYFPDEYNCIDLLARDRLNYDTQA